MTELLALAPILVAMVTGTVTLAIRRWPQLQRQVDIGGTAVYAGVVGLLVWKVVFAADAGPIAYQVGGWRAPFSITVVADGLAVFMLAMTAIVALYAAISSARYIDPDTQTVYYHPLFQFLLLGATGAFLTGDLFNLFVWFEVMLMASYVFVAFYGDASHTAAAMRYVVLNVIGGVVMLVAIGGLYATLGTLNMADMAVQIADPPDGTDIRPVVGLSGLLLTTFAIKAGLVPFQFWVPAAYRAAPLPVVAMFAGATKKVGIYVILRLYFTVFGEADLTVDVPGVAASSPLAFLAPVLLTMGLASILVGGLGAVSQDRLDGLFAYSSIGQVGFIAVAIAIAAGTSSASLRKLGVLAALLFAFHHALTKALLFLSTAVIKDATGTTKLSKLGGIGERSAPFATVFLIGCLSLVGIPPLAGFFGKLFVFDVAATLFASVTTAGTWETAGAAGILLVLLAGAVLTIIYSTRAWIGSIWGNQTDLVRTAQLDGVQIWTLASMAGLVVAFGVGFEAVYQFAEAAAEAAIATDAYVETVDPAGGEVP